MAGIYIYNVLLVAVCAYAGWGGGWPERLVAAAVFIASLATLALPFNFPVRFHQVEVTIAFYDIFVLVTVVLVALYADRFWPMWLAVLIILVIAVHGVAGYKPNFLWYLYSFLAQKSWYLALIIIAVGVLRHRARVRLWGGESDWSPREPT